MGYRFHFPFYRVYRCSESVVTYRPGFFERYLHDKMLVNSGFFEAVSTKNRRPRCSKQTLPIVRTECWNADFEICITLVQITNAWIFMLMPRLTIICIILFIIVEVNNSKFVCVNFYLGIGGTKLECYLSTYQICWG